MSRFEVYTPVSGFSGVAADVAFQTGKAVVDSEAQLDALAYFRSAGYDIRPLDDVDVDVALAEGVRGRMDGTARAAALRAEIAEKELQLGVSDLERRNAELDDQLAARATEAPGPLATDAEIAAQEKAKADAEAASKAKGGGK